MTGVQTCALPIYLNKIFAGNWVEVTHPGNEDIGATSGVCKTFREDEKVGIVMELIIGIVPDALTDISVEGNLHKTSSIRRKIQLPKRRNRGGLSCLALCAFS